MVLKGYKQPLVQEDLWDLKNKDSTPYINEQFQHFMQSELAAARVRYQDKLKNKRDKAQEEALKNGLSNSLGKGVSQDVLVMVKSFIIYSSALFILLYLFYVFME